MSKYRDTKRDQRMADDAGVDRDLMCQANGCPNLWSVEGQNGRCCSAHAWSALHLWPQITAEQQDAETDRALHRLQHVEPPPAPPMSRAEKRAALASLSAVASRIGRVNPRAWAYALRDREQRGERLTDAQRKTWRSVVDAHAVLDRVRDGDDVPAERVTQALQVTGDLPRLRTDGMDEAPWTELDDVPVFEEHEA